MNDTQNSSLRSQMGPLLFLVGIFLLNFLARVIFSPLMPTIEKDLKIGHDEAGSLFMTPVMEKNSGGCKIGCMGRVPRILPLVCRKPWRSQGNKLRPSRFFS